MGYSPDGLALVTGNSDGAVLVWDTVTGANGANASRAYGERN